jgi:uncharacterized protein YifN (PemK superfamily)
MLDSFQELLGWFNICKSTNAIQHINRIMDKYHIIVPINTEKASDKIQNPLTIEVMKKLGMEGTYLGMIKATYDKTIANTI